MNFGDERYVRVYTRDTVDWQALGWEAQALFLLMLRKVDRAGILDLGRSGVRGLAAMVAIPVDVTERSLQILLDDGCIEQRGTALIVRNFIEAQEACMSPAVRQQESRLRRRDMLRSGLDPDQKETVIYFVQGEDGGPVKIGKADDLAKRLIGLGTSRPDKLVVLAAAPGTVEQERLVHARFASVREKGEWFTATDELMTYTRLVAANGAGAWPQLNTFTVTNRDASQKVTSHETVAVTPIRAVPSEPPVLAVPTHPDPPETRGVEAIFEDDEPRLATVTHGDEFNGMDEAMRLRSLSKEILRTSCSTAQAIDFAGHMRSAMRQHRRRDLIELLAAFAVDGDGFSWMTERKPTMAYLLEKDGAALFEAIEKALAWVATRKPKRPPPPQLPLTVTLVAVAPPATQAEQLAGIAKMRAAASGRGSAS